MIIYFYLFIPFLLLSTDSSSIRDRTFKNELVPFLSSRSDPTKKDSNSLKIVSNEPFIVQLQMPNSVEKDIKRTDEKDKKRKRPGKKRVSKIKGLRKKHRRRRDLLISKTKSEQEKSNQSDITHAVKTADQHLKNINSINRNEILKALSSYSKILETKRSKLEGIKNAEKNNTEKTKQILTPSRNLQKHHSLLPDRTPYVKMIYPSTPKFDENQQKYTYKDLMADRERLEQKIKYIKNMLNVNVTADDAIRVRRKSDSDKTANKIAKMFLTLSAVNGLHDRKKSKCDKEDEEEIWGKERRSSTSKKSFSSNEERYKVKKWIEFMKNKRSSSKTCPCMTNTNGEEGEVFPLEQKLSSGYNIKETVRSSEESSESFSDPYYYSREKLKNSKKRFSKSQESENKLKALAKNGKKKLELPLSDLELYRSRAKQILQNAEEILDRIKEEEERRLSMPNAFMSQLKELTSRIQEDPRNNENDLIRKIQKNLGWGPLAKIKEGTDDNNFMDNVKSFILEPYEKAKALTDESTKKLSSYLLKNLGKLQESSEEEGEAKENDEKPNGGNLQVYFEQIPQKEDEKPVSANLAKEEPAQGASFKDKEDSQNREDTLSIVLGDGDKKGDSGSNQEDSFKQKMTDIIKEQQKKLNEYKETHDLEQNSQETEIIDDKMIKETNTSSHQGQLNKEIVKESRPEGNLGEDMTVQLKNVGTNKENQETTGTELSERVNNTEPAVQETENPDFVEKKKNPAMAETFQGKEDETEITTSKNMPEEKEFQKEIEDILTNKSEKDIKFSSNEGETEGDDETEKEQTVLREEIPKNEDLIAKKSEDPKAGREKSGDPKLKELNPNQSQESESNESSEAEKENESVTLKVLPDNKNQEGIETDKDPKTGQEESKALEEYEKVAASPNIQETISEEKTGDLHTTNEKEIEGDILSSPHYTLSDELEKPAEYLKAAFEESSTKPDSSTVLKNQKKPEIKTNEEDQENRDENKEFSDTSQNSKETITLKSPLKRDQYETLEDNQNASNVEAIPVEDSAIKPSEHADSVQEGHQELKEFSEGSNLISSASNGEQTSAENLTLKSPIIDEDDKSTEKKDNGTLKATLSAEDDMEKLQETLEKESESSDEQNREASSEENEKKHSYEKFEETEKPEKPENEDGFDRADKIQLKAEHLESQENESLESRSGTENENSKVLEAANSAGEMNIQSLDNDKVESFNSESTQDDLDEVSNEEGGETPLAATDSEINKEESDEKEVDNSKGSEKVTNSNEEGSNKTFVQTSLNQDQDFDKKNSGETALETTSSDLKIKEIVDDETQKSDEHTDKTLLKAEEDKETLNVSEETVLKSLKPTKKFSSQEDQKNESLNKEDSETSLGVAEIDSENVEQTGDKTPKEDLKDKNTENSKELDEVPLMKVNESQLEDMNENQAKETNLNSQEENNERSEETSLKELNPNQSQESESNESSEAEKENESVTLKVLPDNKNQEGIETDNDVSTLRSENPNADVINDDQEIVENEQRLYDDTTNESLKATLNEETQDKLDEASPGESITEAELSEESERIQENVKESNLQDSSKEKNRQDTHETDKNEVLKEVNPKESQRKESSDETSVGVVLEIQEQATEIPNDETEEIPSRKESHQHEENRKEADNNEKILKAENSNKDENNKYEGEDNQDIFEEGKNEISLGAQTREMDKDETLKMENLKKDEEKENLENAEDDKRTPLRANFKDDSDYEIDDDAPLKSAKEIEDRRSSEETSQAKNNVDDFNNQLDRESLLKSRNFDEESTKRFFEDSQGETLRQENSSNENLSVEDNELKLNRFNVINEANSPDPQEVQNQSSSSELLQVSDSASKFSKTGKLKVPKSIGKIMEDLEGKQKDDLTSIQNLNPDKIDHILYKIDEAEQRNLLQSQEVDCRKECACADEIDTKSRNMGRYEIAKDFLYWIKDLQLNRVLSDD